MASVRPFLWYDGRLGEALDFYAGIFGDDFEVLERNELPEGTPGPDDRVTMAKFRLSGYEYWALNGGAEFRFNSAFSLFLLCADQAEVDRYWEALLDGGQPVQCGWLTDRFGLSWQVVPQRLGELLGSSDREAAGRAMQAMLKMIKLDVAELEAAFNG